MIRLTGQHAIQLRDLLQGANGQLPSPLLEVLDVITQQLNNPGHLSDLMDTMVDTLQGNGVDQGMSRNMVQSLRRAVLSPLELAKLKAKSNAGQSCAECHRKFGDAEMATISRERLFCQRCFPADYVMCHQCEQALDVSGIRKTIERARQRHQCSGQRPQEGETEDGPTYSWSDEAEPAQTPAPPTSRRSSSRAAAIPTPLVTNPWTASTQFIASTGNIMSSTNGISWQPAEQSPFAPDESSEDGEDDE